MWIAIIFSSFSGNSIRSQLEWQCGQPINPFRCGDTSFCVYGSEKCNGIANCPEGEDEDFDMCKDEGVFSDLATIECYKANIYNVSIKIKAVPCNGINECEHDLDELNCSLPDLVFIISLGVMLMIVSIMTIRVKKSTMSRLVSKPNNQTIPLHEFESLHGTVDLKNKMFQVQMLGIFEDVILQFVNAEMKVHGNVDSEIVCCIKVSISFLCTSIHKPDHLLRLQDNLDTTTTAAVMKTMAEADSEESWVNKLSKSLHHKLQVSSLKIALKKFVIVKIILVGVLHLVDLIKDCLILFEISRSQGGIAQIVMYQPTPYIRWVMFFSILKIHTENL